LQKPDPPLTIADIAEITGRRQRQPEAVRTRARQRVARRWAITVATVSAVAVVVVWLLMP